MGHNIIEDLHLPLHKRYLTANEVAGCLNVSRSTVGNMIKAKILEPIPIAKAAGYVCKAVNGRKPGVVFRSADVGQLMNDRVKRRLSAGEIAAKCFKLFREGQTIADVVILLEITPALAVSMCEAYRMLHDAVLLAPPTVKALRLIGIKATSDEQFAAVVERLIEEVRRARQKNNATS
jgi:hypothetical protein